MRLISDVMQSILPPGMRAPTRPARDSRRLLGLGAILLSLGGCKAAGTTSAEAPAAQLDDIVAIESELAMNAERLEAQGVRVARAPKVQADVAGGAARAVADGDDDETVTPGPAPASPPAEPEPEPEPAPAPIVEAEEDAMDRNAPERDAPRGLSLSKRKAEKRKKRDKKTRCERICDLAEATCTLADRICGLADEHVDDVRYEDACGRAESQCEAASDACSACED